MKKLLGLAALLTLCASANAFDVKAKYNASCMACHAFGAAGAPITHSESAWKPRLDLGMDTLVASVTNGKGSMPPKGLCMDCTADQYKQLIEFMSKAK
jgi:cytochrome c5